MGEKVDDAVGWDGVAGCAQAAAGPFAGVLGPQPVGGDFAERGVLDAVDDGVGVVGAAFAGVEPVDFEDLELQRDGQAVLGASGAQADEYLAVLLHGAVGGGLQAVDVLATVGVGERGPLGPEGVERGGGGGQAARCYSGADDVGYEGVEAATDVRDVLYQGA